MSEAFYVPDGTTIVSEYIIPYGEDTVILPDSVKEIADNAFQNNEFLQKIVIRNGIERIGKLAFSCCEKLSQIFIPNTVAEIGSNAFTACKALRRVYLPDSITNLGALVFWHCSNVFDLKYTVTFIGNDTLAFDTIVIVENRLLGFICRLA